MPGGLFTSRAKTANAKVGAIVMATSALATLVLTHVLVPLAPLRIVALAAVAFAVWAFCDEMGLRKPLNRAGFVCFSIAAISKVVVTVGIPAELHGRYLLLYAAMLLLAVLFWSVAFLHRSSGIKIVGAVGAAASGAAIIALVAGHLAVGAGAFLGVQAVLAATDGSSLRDLGFVGFVERVFGLWCYLAAWLLWRGHITDAGSRAQTDISTVRTMD